MRFQIGSKQRISKAEEQHVVHRAFAEIVVDAEDVTLIEHIVQDAIEILRRSEIGAERFFDDDARAIGAAGFFELLDHETEQYRRDCEIVGWMFDAAEFLAKGLECLGIIVVAIDITHEAAERFERLGIETAMRLRDYPWRGLSDLRRPASLGDADHRNLQGSALDHRLERRKNLLVRKIAGRAEEDQSIRLRRTHLALLLDVAAELEAHGGEKLVGEIRLAARAEALIKCGGQHIGGHGFVDRRLDRPAALA